MAAIKIESKIATQSVQGVPGLAAKKEQLFIIELSTKYSQHTKLDAYS